MWHGAEMAVTMICIGMPVCRPAVSSMLQACGLGPRKPRDRTSSSSNYHHHHKKQYTPTVGSSYIRNYGGGTWEEAVGGADIDSWSQRRILGVGDATSNATSTSTTTTTTTSSTLNPPSSKEAEAGIVGLGGGGTDVYPMTALNKVGGITVTKTVDITQDERISN